MAGFWKYWKALRMSDRGGFVDLNAVWHVWVSFILEMNKDFFLSSLSCFFAFLFFPPQGCTVQYFNNSEIKIYCVYNIHGINQKLLLFWECVWERRELPPDFPWEACKGTGRQKPHREMYANPQDSVDFCIHCGWPRMSAASYPLRSNFCS